MASIAPMAHTRREGLTTDSWITPRWIILDAVQRRIEAAARELTASHPAARAANHERQ